MAKSASELTLQMASQLPMRLRVLFAFFLALAVPSRAADDPTIVKGTDQFEFIYQVKVPEIKGEARVWVPLAKTDAFQTVTEEKPKPHGQLGGSFPSQLTGTFCHLPFSSFQL